ncbi:hypothetical protein H8S90_01635 [Olivibacter sp. SDN3]|uniref:hypothetical protein n=1 Tax=Olivibacter sp. SDN3 TaxID=2764720 RepID=UPI0016512503|nr:hypothetical protein [Olivibacter sp. SDN3]QNL50355.1 hypothetical protein H8S90_01635 [Olivibacter sp. SDN3]
MKRYLLSILFLLAVFISRSQVVRIDTASHNQIHVPNNLQKPYSSEFMYSVALRAFALEQFPQIFNNPEREQFYSSAFNGLTFKFNDNQISYRITGIYFNNDVSSNKNCLNCEQIGGKLQNTALKIGFEKNITYTRIQPYFGLDIGYMNQKYAREEYNSLAEQSQQEVIDRKNSALASPFIGIKFNVLPYLTVVAESNFTIAYSYQKTERASSPDTPHSREKWEYFFAPVGSLGIQFNFGTLY